MQSLSTYLYIGCLAMLLYSCQSPSSTTSSATQEPQKAIVDIPQDKKILPPPSSGRGRNFETELLDSFTKEQISILKNANKEFNNIKTAKELANFYQTTLPQLITLLNRKIGQYDPEASDANSSEKWLWLNEYMPYLTVEFFCSECGTEAYAVVNTLRDKAEITPEKADDLYFDALLTAYQPDEKTDRIVDKMPNNWLKLVGCDMCGADILGNGKYINTLKALDKASDSGLFSKEITEFKASILPSQPSSAYYFTKEEAIDELEQILNAVQLSPKEKDKVKNLRYLLNIGKDIQFDCQKGNCEFVAM